MFIMTEMNPGSDEVSMVSMVSGWWRVIWEGFLLREREKDIRNWEHQKIPNRDL